VPLAGAAVDLVAITALVYAFPLALAPWALYVFAIGAAALRFGPVGAVGMTALAVVGFDAALAIRAGEARATDLWAVQALIAIGLVVAEIAWALGRKTADPAVGRARAMGALVRIREPEALLGAAVAEVARSSGVRGVWVWARGPDHRLRVTAASGVTPAVETVVSADMLRRLHGVVPLDRVIPEQSGLVIPVSIDPPLSIAVDVAGASKDDRAAVVAAARDLVADIAPLVSVAFERTGLAEDGTALVSLASAIGRVTSERTQAGAFASLVVEAGHLVEGQAAIVRSHEGTAIAGDLDAAAIAQAARDRRLPSIAMIAGAQLALVGLGEGRVLAAVGDPDRLAMRITHLERLAFAARDRLALLAERDEIQRSAQELGRDVEHLGGALRAREDALATAVHELRNPLTAVHGYATLMSRNLTAVQGQLKQLERLMADLLSSEQRGPGADESVDAVVETREAIARARVRSGVEVDLDAPDAPVLLAIDRARFAQVLDNLLANAAKYSPPNEPVVMRVERGDQQARISVSDRGIGIPPEHLERIFDRFYRVPGSSEEVSGQGLGLSICREIVATHGGDIRAMSEGTGRGSTFTFTLPLAQERAPA